MISTRGRYALRVFFYDLNVRLKHAHDVLRFFDGQKFSCLVHSFVVSENHIHIDHPIL